MSRWLICRPEFCPCLLHAIRREGPYGYAALILFLISFASAVGLTIDCLYDVSEAGNEPFYEIFATLMLYILCGLIFFLFGGILLKTIREEIAEIDRVRRAPRQAVFYRRIPNEELEAEAEDSDSSGNLTNPSGYVSADIGAISDESDSLSGASRSTAAASGSASATSGYTSGEPEMEAAALSASMNVLPGALPSTQVIQTQPRAIPYRFLARAAGYLSAQAQRLAIQTQPRAIPGVHRSSVPNRYALRQQIEESEFRSGLDSVKDSAIYVYEELEVKRSQANPEELKEIHFPDEEGYKSIEEMQVRLVRRRIHSTAQEE